MPNYITHNLYNDKVKILFDEDNHAYWIEEKGKKRRLAGVTTFISVLDKPALITWAVGVTVDYVRDHIDLLKEDPTTLLKLAREESNNQKNIAAEIGSAIHLWVSQHIKGEQPEMPEDERVVRGVNSFLDWVNENDVKFKESEVVVYHPEHDYVGTADIVATINGEDYLLDIKTGNALYAEVKLQTAAYKRAYELQTGTQLKGRWALRISKESEEEYRERMAKKGKSGDDYKIFEAVYLGDDDFDDFEGFINCVNIYRWKRQAEKSF